MTRDELLRKWVAALESGEYQQARATLRTQTGFCCLGVGCDISGAGEWRPINGLTFTDIDETEQPYTPESDLSSHVFVVKADHEEVSMPNAIRRLFGLDAYKQAELQTMNDDGRSFIEIAGKIRSWFPEAFETVPA